jgi:hypothetical protein
MELSEKKKALMAKIFGGNAPEIALRYMKRRYGREEKSDSSLERRG